jgi:hypothetical protein
MSTRAARRGRAVKREGGMVVFEGEAGGRHETPRRQEMRAKMKINRRIGRDVTY